MGAARLLLSLAFSSAKFLPISTQPSFLVLGFAFGLALITGIVFGAVPAWFATRTNPVEALRGSGRSTGDHSSFTRTALLIVQATLSVVLIAGSTMLARSLNNLENQDFGYQVKGRVLVALNRAPADYTFPKLAALYRQLEDRLNTMPGVRASGLAMYNPLTDNWGEMILVAGHPPPGMNDNAGASWDRVSAGYLENLGVTTVSRTHVHRRRQRNDGAGRSGQRGVREALLQERRGSARAALRPGSAGKRRHLPHRRRRSRCQVRRLRAAAAGPADVLRAARAECGLQAAADAAHRVVVTLHSRHPAGHRSDAGHARTACHPHAGGSRSRT